MGDDKPDKPDFWASGWNWIAAGIFWFLLLTGISNLGGCSVELDSDDSSTYTIGGR